MRRSRVLAATGYALALAAFLTLGLANTGALAAEQSPILTWLFTWADKEEETEDEDANEEPLESDRPDFTESSTTVGDKRLQFEGGYRYTQAKGGDPSYDAHDLPELLVRYGLAERLELRIAWDEGLVFDRFVNRAGRVFGDCGGTDMEFGFKYALTKQKKWFPQTALIVAATAPTGGAVQSSRQVDPRINYCYSWEFTKKLSLGCSTGNRCTQGSGDHFSQFFHSTSVEYELTKKLHVFNEWFLLCYFNADDNRPQHYYDAGLTYLVTPNFQLDWSAGVGLSETSDGFFTGCGVTIRK
jgi:hypothetical protein